MMLSVCIPVYNGEQYLSRCLESLARQTFKNFEVIVVDDCSPGKDSNGWSCRKLCRKLRKQTDLDLSYIPHTENKGSMEARRTATYASSGDYILFLDCDDALEDTALEKLAQKAEATGADIVQCGVRPVFALEDGPRVAEPEIDSIEEGTNLLIPEMVKGKDILDNAIMRAKISTFVWGKLMKRDLLVKAWEHIPPMYGVWCEDYLMVFFITYFAETYIGLPEKLYLYSVDTGISTTVHIADLTKWEKFCAVTSVFNTIYMQCEDGLITLTEEEDFAVHAKCDQLVTSNLIYLEKFVDPAISQEARTMLIDYSGEAYIKSLEKLLNLPEI